MKIIYPSATFLALHMLHYTILYRQVNKKNQRNHLRSDSYNPAVCPLSGSFWKPPTALVPRDMISISSPCYFKAVTGCILDRPGHLHLEAPQLLRLSLYWPW
jgi:hypothetical protein